MIGALLLLAAAAAQPAPNADLAEIDKAVHAVYDVISGPPGQKRDFDRMRSLFAPNATLKAIGPKGLRGGSLEDYITRNAAVLEKEGKLPDLLIACVGGGSNAIGLFHEFLREDSVKMMGVEAGGRSLALGEHAARFTAEAAVGVLQGTKSYLLQDRNGQIAGTHSISAGLDYASVGPEHAFLHDRNRVDYTSVTDDEALDAFQLLSETEGIIPALESAHAIAQVAKTAPEMSRDSVIVVNLSGRGDKDVHTVAEVLKQRA